MSTDYKHQNVLKFTIIWLSYGEDNETTVVYNTAYCTILMFFLLFLPLLYCSIMQSAGKIKMYIFLSHCINGWVEEDTCEKQWDQRMALFNPAPAVMGVTHTQESCNRNLRKLLASKNCCKFMQVNKTQTWRTINMIDNASRKHSSTIKPHNFAHMCRIELCSIWCIKLVRERN